MKVGIVNDTPMMVEVLRRVVAESQRHELIWVARDGAEAVQMCAWQLPDIVLMDLLMPNLDGVEATRQIMQRTPCPILIVTANMGSSAGKIYEALGAGALDAVQTPVLAGGDLRQNAAALIAKMERLSGVSTQVMPAPKAEPQAELEAADPSTGVVAIGASAGGPAMLAQLLSKLPADFPAALVIVQHIDVAFAPGLADWLQRESKLDVRLAREGDRPQRGQALLAGSDRHLVFRSGGALTYEAGKASDVYRPSIDVFFHSVVKHWRGSAAGVLLTGMGRDGALGLKAMRERGFYTVAQHQKGCAVYGMPKAAAEAGAATEMLSVPAMVPALLGVFH